MKNHRICGLVLVVGLAGLTRPSAGVNLSEHVYSLLHARDGALYAGTASADGPGSEGVVYKSVDGGVHWTNTASLGGPTSVGGIEALIQTTGGGMDGDLFIGTAWNGKIFKSSNGGDAWVFLTNLFQVYEVDVLKQASNGDLYAGAHCWSPDEGQIHRSTNEGATWQLAAAPSIGQLTGMRVIEEILVTSNGTFFCTGEPGHVWRSYDGTNWDKVGTNTIHFGGAAKNYSLLETSDGSVYVAGRTPAGVYRTTDSGHSWVQVADSAELGGGVTRCEGLFQASDGTIYVGTDTACVYRSVDGDNWELVIVFPGIDRVNVITEGAAGAMYVGTSGLGDVHTLWTPTDGRFFRVMGPAESTIVGWTKAGMLTWTNTDEVLDVPVLIEACTDLVASNWGAYIQAACTARVNAAQIYHPQ